MVDDFSLFVISVDNNILNLYSHSITPLLLFVMDNHSACAFDCIEFTT